MGCTKATAAWPALLIAADGLRAVVVRVSTVSGAVPIQAPAAKRLATTLLLWTQATIALPFALIARLGAVGVAVLKVVLALQVLVEAVYLLAKSEVPCTQVAIPFPLPSNAILAAVTAVVVFSSVVLFGVDQAPVDAVKREKYRLSAVCVPVFCSHSTVALFSESIATLGTMVLVMLLLLAVPMSSTTLAAACQAVPL